MCRADGVVRPSPFRRHRLGAVADSSEPFTPGSIAFRDVILNLQHDRKLPLALSDGCGLELRDGPDALRAVIESPDTADGRDARTLIQRRVLRACPSSFAPSGTRGQAMIGPSMKPSCPASQLWTGPPMPAGRLPKSGKRSPPWAARRGGWNRSP